MTDDKFPTAYSTFKWKRRDLLHPIRLYRDWQMHRFYHGLAKSIAERSQREGFMRTLLKDPLMQELVRDAKPTAELPERKSDD